MTSAQADNKIGVADSPTAVPSSGRTFPVNDYAFERIIYRASHEALAPIPWPTGSPLSVPLRPGGRPTTSPGGCGRRDVDGGRGPSAGRRADTGNAELVVEAVRAPVERVPTAADQPLAGAAGRLPRLRRQGQDRLRQRLVDQVRATPGHRRRFGADGGLWQQIVAEARPSLIITTGTAGGIGAPPSWVTCSPSPMQSSTALRISDSSHGPSNSSPEQLFIPRPSSHPGQPAKIVA